MGPKIALPAQQRGSPLYFFDYLRMLGSYKTEPSGSVSATPFLSRRTEPRHLIGPIVMAKLAEGGPCGLVHTREVDSP